jgi:hypothetical protein
MHALPRLTALDWISLAIFFASWAGYAWFSEHSRGGAGGLIGTSQKYRLQWAYRMLEREVRVMDSTLIGNLMTSVSFYANTTIYIIAGLVAALGASDKLLSFTADLPFGGAGNRELLEIKLMLLLASFVLPTSNSPGRCASSTCSPSLSGPHRSARLARRASTAMPGAWPAPTILQATISIVASAPTTSAWPLPAGCLTRCCSAAWPCLC